MKLKELTLHGFTGIKKGLGLDTVSLDVSGLSGLIALDGPNGSSKTTLLDNLQPYRTLPSRGKSLKHHVFLRDSFKDLSFNFNGDEYRTLVKIDSDSERSEGFIWKNGESLVDGKVTSYDQYINNLFGSQTLFVNSVFCAQGSKRINELTTGKLKELFSEFLRLDKYVEWENTAKQCHAVLESHRQTMDRDIEKLLERARGKADLENHLRSLEFEKTTAEGLQETTIAEARDWNSRLDELKERKGQNAVAEARLKDLGTGNEKATQDFRASEIEFEKQIDSLTGALVEAASKIAACDRVLAGKEKIERAVNSLVNIKGTIARTEKSIIEYRVTFDRCSNHERDLEKALAIETEAFNVETERLKSTLEKAKSQRKEIAYEVQAIEKEVELFGNELVPIDQRIATAEEKIRDLDKRDPECKSTICSYIVGAIDAEKTLPELKSTRKTIKAELREKIIASNGELIDLEKQRALLVDGCEDLEKKIAHRQPIFPAADPYEKAKKNTEIQRKHLKIAEADLAKLRGDLAVYEKRAEGKTAIAKAETELEHWTSRKAELNAKLVTKRDARGRAIEAYQKLSAGYDDEMDRVRESIDYGIDQRIDDTDEGIARFRRDIAELGDQITKTRLKIGEVQKEIESTDKAQTDADDLIRRQETITRDSADWLYLKTACSKDGLRALEIDAVAPAIAAYANDLLNRTFGPNYSVRFRTKSDDDREVLDILVIREDGAEIVLDNLSGGEKVWCLKALRLAMTLIAKEKSGRIFQTALSDEEDGSLDVSNARHFVEMYRAFMDVGGFENCFYITHKPECVAMADHVISFRNGRIEVS